MDAIVIACANRNIVNYLNNESAKQECKDFTSRPATNIMQENKNRQFGKLFNGYIDKPWDTFTQDVYSILGNIIVSFKTKICVLSIKQLNHYNPL